MKIIEMKKSLPDEIIKLMNDILSNPEKYLAISICYQYMQDGLTVFNFQDTCSTYPQFFGLMQAAIIKAGNNWIKEDDGKAREPY